MPYLWNWYCVLIKPTGAPAPVGRRIYQLPDDSSTPGKQQAGIDSAKVEGNYSTDPFPPAGYDFSLQSGEPSWSLTNGSTIIDWSAGIPAAFLSVDGLVVATAPTVQLVLMATLRGMSPLVAATSSDAALRAYIAANLG